LGKLKKGKRRKKKVLVYSVNDSGAGEISGEIDFETPFLMLNKDSAALMCYKCGI
jgi:hypothetical protein